MIKNIVGWFIEGVIVVSNTAKTYSCIFSLLRRYLFNLEILDILDAELGLNWWWGVVLFGGQAMHQL